MIRDRQIVLNWSRDSDPAFLRSREWLLTNGLGGYASGTLAGIPARKYHGLFVPNLASPKGRHILISRCDECLNINGRQMHLGGAEYDSERFEGEAHLFLREFRLDRRVAVWTFEHEGVVFEKSIVMVHNQNTVCVQYRLLQGEALELQVRPFVSFRRHDESPHGEPGSFILQVQRGRHEIRHTESELILRYLLSPGPTAFVTEECDERNFVYRIERDRGDPEFESAFSPGYLLASVRPDQPAVFVASTQAWDQLEFDAPAVFEAERHRLDNLLTLAPAVHDDPVAEQLAMAADQFIVQPGSRMDESVLAQAGGGELRSIYAGYHWFGDWGRDTMISLEGLALCTGRYREAGAILSTFSHYVKDGLLPNLYPEGARQALYHTVDATLWYFHAISRYVETTADRALMRNLFPVLQSIVQHHIDGTHFNIHVDPKDGLISAAADGYQLTWMDAKVDGWVVTPRRGKPVEIQALWHNALQLMTQWAVELRQPHEQYQTLAAQVRESFNQRYWNAQRGCLYDVIDGPEGDDDAIRPNQIFTLSLQHPVLYQRHWKEVVDVVRDKLLTPYGLRTLSADHPDYKRHYRGNLRARDAAYHQGTVWPWLIGHFVDAHMRVYPDPAGARALLETFPGHLYDAGIGSISEVFDAEEPFAPGGCVAQAWSVAEVLRAWLKTKPGASSSGH